MIDNLLYLISGHHRRIRHLTFDELSELYMSMMLRTLAISIAGIFIPIYLYKQGESIPMVFLFYVVFFGAFTLAVFPVAHLIARFGPKRIIVFSFLMQSLALAGLIYMSKVPFLLSAVLLGLSQCLFFLPMHIDFSKVKHRSRAGKELSWYFISERLGAVAGPLVGGLLAYFYDIKYTLLASIVVLVIASFMLIASKETMKTHQKLNFRGFKIREIKRDLITYSAFTIDGVSATILWSFFIGVVVFRENPYITIGSATSISIIVSIVVTKMIGKLVDNKKGRMLLRYNASINSIGYLVRPFVTNYAGVVGMSIYNEAVTPGYRMAVFKGVYAAADDHPGERIVYMSVMEFMASMSRTLFFILAMILAWYIQNGRVLFGVLFVITSFYSLGILLEKFKALEKRKGLL